MSQEIMKYIDDIIKSRDIVLFMKGSPGAPRCGFSARVVDALESLGAHYIHVDVLEDPEIRTGIKVYSDWPTIPQLYIRGQFIGGCDIVSDLHSSGKLEKMLLGLSSEDHQSY